MKTAFLFAGQGSQTLGMGRDFYDRYALVRATFDEASRVLGYDLRALIDQDEKRLSQTRYTQPAILTLSVAIYRLLKERGILPDFVAGLSMGEYSALVASGALDFSEAVDLVAKRGKYMEEAVPADLGKMVAILNTESSLIEEACKAAGHLGIVSPANYNTPSQIVIGGENQAVDFATAYLKEHGVKKMVPLSVSGPFHTALLEPASQKLQVALEKVNFKTFQVPLVGNTLAQPMKEEEIISLLTRQVKEPVRFYESILSLKNLGAEGFVEIGPGKVLSAFVKKIDKTAQITSICDVKSFETYVGEENGN